MFSLRCARASARTTFRLARTALSNWRTISIGHECYCSRGRPMRARRNKIRGNIGYEAPSLRLTDCHPIPVVSEMAMFNALDRLRPTAEGQDGLPAWYLRLLAPICSRSLTHLVNLSVLQSCVPRQWKTAIIHSVPKVQNPSTPAEYRPISVVSILSRIVKRIIVHSYIYPAFLKPPVVENIKDQFAFRPTVSTTAAVIDLLQQTTTLLLTNDFVVIISLDFTKAFDTVRYQTLD